MWDNIKSKMGMGQPAQPQTLPQQLIQSATQALDDATPTLSWKQRAIGFGICFGIGLLFSFLVRFSCSFVWQCKRLPCMGGLACVSKPTQLGLGCCMEAHLSHTRAVVTAAAEQPY